MFGRLLPLLAMAATGSLLAVPDHFEWINPLPHRQDWKDVAAGPAGFVGITDGLGGRDIYRSADGARWERIAAPKTYGLKRVAFLNGNYIAVGNNGIVLSSPDGVDWQVRHDNDPGALLLDVAYGNGKYMTVGYNAVAYASSDLTNWTKIAALGPGYSLTEIEFGNGVFLAFGGKLMRSTDGVNWTEIPFPADVPAFQWFNWDRGLAFYNGKFVVSGPNGTATSTDGIHWTQSAADAFAKIVTTSDGMFGLAGVRLARSGDGVTWTTVLTLPSDSIGSPQLSGSASLNGHWVAVGDAGLLATSTDGLSWTNHSKAIDFSHGSIAYGNGQYIRYGNEEGSFVSSDGDNWTLNADSPGLETLVAGNGVWVGITSSNEAAVSQDGIAWQTSELPATAYGKILFANGTFLVAADGGVLVSSNGVEWQTARIGAAKSVRIVGYQNGVFAAITDSMTSATSADGLHWTVQPAQADMSAPFYATGNGRFVGIRGGGMGPGGVVWSTDGIHWQNQQLTSGGTYIYTSLEFGGGYFVMTDSGGSVYYSTDGIDWTGGLEARQPFTGSAFGPGNWVVIGGDSILKSGSRLQAASVATLQLKQQTFSTWSLVVSGSAGQAWRIESSAALDTGWQPLTTVQIPVLGQVSIPLNANQTSGFFRAVAGN